MFNMGMILRFLLLLVFVFKTLSMDINYFLEKKNQ